MESPKIHASLGGLGLAIGLWAFGLSTSGTAWARPEYPAFIPHGGTLECDMCHDGEPPTFNLMGQDVEPIVKEGLPIWETLAPLDSDEDGFTNGEELGDPNALFQRWGPDPLGPFTHPGRPESRPEGPIACGNQRQDPGEACDGPVDCAALGWSRGSAVCVGCAMLETSGCSGRPGEDAGAVDVDGGFGSPDAGVAPGGPTERGSGCRCASRGRAPIAWLAWSLAAFASWYRRSGRGVSEMSPFFRRSDTLKTPERAGSSQKRHRTVEKCRW